MRFRFVTVVRTSMALIGAASVVPAVIAAQTPTAKATVTAQAPKQAWKGPRTKWGAPDLQGTWTNSTSTPLERPQDLAGKEVLAPEEVEERTRQFEANRDRPPRAGDPGTYNSFWQDDGHLLNRTSLITDPPDGRLPFTPEGQARVAAALDRRRKGDSWEDRGVYERCLTRGLPGSMMGGFYNHNYQIVQSPSHVVILVEMIHDARIVPLDGRPRLGAAIRQWMGDSRGHWEGETLVVETTNFNGRVPERSILAFGSSDRARLTERFRRADDHTIDYQFTVDDPGTFTRPWTAIIPMRRIEGPVFEYACHEGNYGIRNVLSGFRAQEKAEGVSPEGKK